MRITLELTISHDGHDWITDDLDCRMRGKNFRQLEMDITGNIRNDPRFIENETIDVTLLFDMDYFPRWLTQYHSHYFNYTFTVDKREVITS